MTPTKEKVGAIENFIYYHKNTQESFLKIGEDTEEGHVFFVPMQVVEKLGIYLDNTAREVYKEYTLIISKKRMNLYSICPACTIELIGSNRELSKAYQDYKNRIKS